MDEVRRKYGFRDWDSVLAAIGHGGLKEGQVVNKLLECYNRDHKSQETDEDILNHGAQHRPTETTTGSRSGIVVKGVDDVAVRFSKCCSPVPGDEIVGFVTRGRGVSIHRKDCVNIINLPEEERGRLIEAGWAANNDEGTGTYLADIKVYANNRTGLLVDITRILTERKIDMCSVNSRINKQGFATLEIEFEINSREQLRTVIEKIKQVESVIDVERSTG